MTPDKWNKLRDYLINELVNEVHNGAVENMIKEVLMKMDGLDKEEFNNRQALTNLEKENLMMKKWIKQGDKPLTPIEEKEISEWIFKNL